MCTSPAELVKLNDEELVRQFERATELDTKHNANGKNPFDKTAIRNELLSRLRRTSIKVGSDKGEKL